MDSPVIHDEEHEQRQERRGHIVEVEECQPALRVSVFHHRRPVTVLDLVLIIDIIRNDTDEPAE